MYRIRIQGEVTNVDPDNKAFKIVSKIEVVTDGNSSIVEVPCIVFAPYRSEWLPAVGNIVDVEGPMLENKSELVSRQDGTMVPSFYISAREVDLIAQSDPNRICRSVTVFGAGNLGGDADFKYVGEKGTPVANFSLALSQYYKPEVEGADLNTLWARCALWGKRAEDINEYMTRGAFVVIIGVLKFDDNGFFRTYTAQDGTTRISFDVHVMDVQVKSGGSTQTRTYDPSAVAIEW